MSGLASALTQNEPVPPEPELSVIAPTTPWVTKSVAIELASSETVAWLFTPPVTMLVIMVFALMVLSYLFLVSTFSLP